MDRISKEINEAKRYLILVTLKRDLTDIEKRIIENYEF